MLRLTAYTTAYTASEGEKQTCVAALSKGLQSAGVDTQISSSAAELLQSSSEYDLITKLWFDTILLFLHSSNDIASAGDVASQSALLSQQERIEPSPQTINSVLSLPTSSLSSCILAALKLGDTAAQFPGTGKKQKEQKKGVADGKSGSAAGLSGEGGGYDAARQMCEWYIAAYSNFAATAAQHASAESAGSSEHASKERIDAAYRKMMELYTLQLLGPKFSEWDYAREMIGYSSLPHSAHEAGANATPGSKEDLLERFGALQTHEESKAERTRVASADLKRAFQKEKERRAELAEKEAAEAAAAAASSGRQHASSRNSSSKTRSGTSGERKKAGNGNGNGNGASGGPAPRRRKSDEETATLASSVSSIASAASSSASALDTSTPPASSAASSPPSSINSNQAPAGQSEGSAAGKKLRRSSSSSSSNSGGSTSPTTEKGSGGEGRRATQPSSTAGGGTPGVGSFAESRTSISKTLERHHTRDAASRSQSAASAGSASQKRNSKAGGASSARAGGIGGLLAYARELFTQGNGTQLAIRYLSTSLIVAFLLQRLVLRRRRVGSGAGSGVGPSTAQLVGERVSRPSSNAAMEARKKLQARRGQEKGFMTWLWSIWMQAIGRVWQTVRM